MNQKQLRENLPVLVFGFNLLLAFALLVQFAFRGGGYSAADPVLDLTQSDVVEIEIEDPRDKLQVLLTRGEELPAPEAAADPEESFNPVKTVDRVRERLDREAEFAWEMKSGGTVHSGDRPRVKDLFKALGDARRYYSVPRTPEKDRDLEMGKNDRGEYSTLRITFKTASGSSETLYLGRARAGSNESYVRLGEEDRIYLVQSDLRTAAGQGDPYFFRDRSVWPRKPVVDRISGLRADFPGKKRDVNLLKGPEGWRMGDPEPAKVRAQEISSLLNDIADWKADAFPAEVPDGLEEDTDFELEISYRDNLTGPVRTIRVEVFGKKDYSTYYLRRLAEENEEGDKAGADGPLVQVTSVYLGDFYEPERKLKDVARPNFGGADGLQ